MQQSHEREKQSERRLKRFCHEVQVSAAYHTRTKK